MQVQRVALEAKFVGDPSLPPKDQGHGSALWKPFPVLMWLPPHTLPSKASQDSCALERPPVVKLVLPAEVDTASDSKLHGCIGAADRRAPEEGPVHHDWVPGDLLWGDMAPAMVAPRTFPGRQLPLSCARAGCRRPAPGHPTHQE